MTHVQGFVKDNSEAAFQYSIEIHLGLTLYCKIERHLMELFLITQLE